MLRRYHDGVFGRRVSATWSCCKSREQVACGCKTAMTDQSPTASALSHVCRLGSAGIVIPERDIAVGRFQVYYFSITLQPVQVSIFTHHHLFTIPYWSQTILTKLSLVLVATNVLHQLQMWKMPSYHQTSLSLQLTIKPWSK